MTLTSSMRGPGSAVGVGHAYGKVILIGEHVVVYGLPAIAVPIPNLAVEATVGFVTASATSQDPSNATELRLICGPRTTAASPSNSGLAAVIEAVMNRWHITDETVEVRVRSCVPPARGLGFSAACAAAVVHAFADLVGAAVDEGLLYELVQAGEQIAHGHPSGVDAAAVAAAMPIRFEAGVVRPIVIAHDVELVVADTGIAGSTLGSVSVVRSVLERNRDWAVQRLARAAAIIESAEECLVNGQLAALGRQLSRFHALLSEFGVSTPEIKRLVDAALAAGAYGAKLTGGGMGGCVLALTDPGSAAAVRAALAAAGATQIWTVSSRDWAQ